MDDNHGRMMARVMARVMWCVGREYSHLAGLCFAMAT